MINAKDAATAAKLYAKEIIDGAQEFVVEEVEYKESPNQRWLITLSMVLPGRGTSIAAVVSGAGTPRDYKVFEIDSETGDVKSMRIRELV